MWPTPTIEETKWLSFQFNFGAKTVQIGHCASLRSGNLIDDQIIPDRGKVDF